MDYWACTLVAMDFGVCPLRLIGIVISDDKSPQDLERYRILSILSGLYPKITWSYRENQLEEAMNSLDFPWAVEDQGVLID